MNMYNKKPDFRQFLKVLKREGKPSHLPFYEHFASGEFIDAATGKPYTRLDWRSDEALGIYVDFWLDMGFDCVPLEVPLSIDLSAKPRSGYGFGSEERLVIGSWKDFEAFPWPSETDPIDFSIFEKASHLLPEGACIVAGVGSGLFEWASTMMGVAGMSYLLADEPQLVEAVFKKISHLILSANRVLAQMDGIGAHKQGDDWGYNAATFLPPELLRKYIFPTYEKMARIAHGAGRPFILHSCGNLCEVYEDVIACGIDAKHSFEDNILPVDRFKRIYGSRITPLGGLDMDYLCRHNAEEVYIYALSLIKSCFGDGFWALGTGNSLAPYLPPENYFAALRAAFDVMG